MYSKKRIFRNSALLLFRSIFVVLLGLYTSRILLAKFGVEDYGVLYVASGLVLMFSSLRTMFTNAIQRYLNYSKGEKNQVKQKQIFNTGLHVQFVAVISFYRSDGNHRALCFSTP